MVSKKAFQEKKRNRRIWKKEKKKAMNHKAVHLFMQQV